MSKATWLVCVSLAAIGCGGTTKFPTAKVTGEVQCNGQPVANVVVYFRPTTSKSGLDAGKVGQGITSETGDFAISTYGSNDGAVIGKNQILVDAPIPDGVIYKGCDCETHSQKVVEEVEVTSDGTNYFAINLKPKAKKAIAKANAEALEEAKKEQEADAAEAAAEKARADAGE